MLSIWTASEEPEVFIKQTSGGGHQFSVPGHKTKNKQTNKPKHVYGIHKRPPPKTLLHGG